MKITTLVILILSLTLFFLVSCTESTSPKTKNHIEGRVVDAEGNPIAEAKIFLSFNLEEIPYNSSSSPKTNSTQERDVKSWISNHNESDTLKVFDTGVIIWDGRDDTGMKVVSNYYDAHFIFLDSNAYICNKIWRNVNYHDVYNSQVNDYTPHAISDSSGFYSINIAKLPFSFSDNEIELYNHEVGNYRMYTVGREVNFWAYHQGYSRVQQDSIYISKGTTFIDDLVMD